MKDVSECKLYLPTSTPGLKTSSSFPQLILPVLVGWSGASHRALAKYGSLYTGMGLAAMCLRPNMFKLLFSGLGNKLTNRILCSISTAAVDREPLPLVLHTFSGAPTVILPQLTSCLHRHPNLRLAGVVFDSAPTPFTYKSGTAAALEDYKQGGASMVGYWATFAVGVATEALVGRKKQAIDAKAFASPVMDVPQLYLYSETDRITPSSHVEEVMERQREMGRQVRGMKWKESRHVKHLIDHPDDYKRELSDFLLHLKY